VIGLDRLSAACREARDPQTDPLAIERATIHKKHCAECRAWDTALADMINVSTADDRLDDVARARIQQKLAKRIGEVATERARPAPQRRWLLGAIAAAAVVLVALLVRSPTEELRSISVPSGGRVAMRIGEAAVAFLGPSEAKIPLEPRAGATIDLERGRVLIEVEHRPDRGFVVRTPEAKVRVVGTLFAVAVDNAGHTFVDVRRGIVEVTTKDGSIRVEAGRGWDAAHGLRAIDPDVDRALRLHGNEPDEVPTPAPAIEEPPIADEPEPSPAPAITPRSKKAITAESRYAEAERAMAAHDRETSVAILTELVSSFPNDPLAGVALYELARIAYDRGDQLGAKAHLEELLSRGAEPSLLESAHYLLCRLEVERDEIAPAYDCLVRFRRSFAGSTRDAEVLATIASLAEKRGGCSEAETWWAEYLRLYPSGPKASELEARRAACAP
jgi:TolA-binding protein